MAKLLLATENLHKVREFQQLLSDWQIYSLKDFPQLQLPPEDGETFQENALIKALAAAEQSGLPALADDSGLVVEALGGAPGVHSARFAGEEKDDAANNARLLQLMADIPPEERQAAFCCVVALAFPDGAFYTTQGRCQGQIARVPAGEGGFGYDCLFYLPEEKRTMAQLSAKEKNALSHRGQAARGMAKRLEKLKSLLDEEEERISGKI